MSTSDKSKGIPCRVCGAPITFSEDQRSSKPPYKMIPLELTLERHQHRPVVAAAGEGAETEDNDDGGAIRDNNEFL